MLRYFFVVFNAADAFMKVLISMLRTSRNMPSSPLRRASSWSLIPRLNAGPPNPRIRQSRWSSSNWGPLHPHEVRNPSSSVNHCQNDSMSFSPDHFLSGKAGPFLRISGLTPSGYGVSILTSAILMAFSYHLSRYSSCSPALAGSLSNGDFSFGECHIHSYSAQPPTSSAVVPACLQFIFLLLPPPFCINLRSTSASCLQY